MTNVESVWFLAGVVAAVWLLPVGVPLVGFAWLAWRHDRRWASLAVAALAAAGLGFTAAFARRMPGAEWVPVAFAAPLVAAGIAWWRPSRATRAATLLAAPLPAL